MQKKMMKAQFLAGDIGGMDEKTRRLSKTTPSLLEN